MKTKSGLGVSVPNWLEGQHATGGLTSEQVTDLSIRLEPRCELLPPNEDPDPELENDADPDVVSRPLRDDGVESQLRAFTGGGEAQRAALRLFMTALDRIPNSSTSPHWTLNRQRRCLRRNLGLPEVLTLYEGRMTMAVEGLSREALATLRDLGASVGRPPYAPMLRLAPRSKWVEIDVAQLPECVEILEAGVAAFVELDTRTTRAPTRQYLSVEAIQTLGRLGKAPAWAAWVPPGS